MGIEKALWPFLGVQYGEDIKSIRDMPAGYKRQIMADGPKTGGIRMSDTMNLQLFAEAPEQGEGTPTETTPNEAGAEKIYTQQQFDAALARKLRGMPSKDEISAYRKWKAGQKPENEPESDAGADDKRRIADLEAQVAGYQSRAKVAAAGVPDSFVEFVTFEAQRGVRDGTDFDTALGAFLEKNPQFTGSADTRPQAWGMRQGGSAPKMSGVEAAFYAMNPNLKK